MTSTQIRNLSRLTSLSKGYSPSNSISRLWQSFTFQKSIVASGASFSTSPIAAAFTSAVHLSLFRRGLPQLVSSHSVLVQHSQVQSSLDGVNVFGGITQTTRAYYGREGTIKWRRRRRKEMEERLKVINPNSPVIDAKFPLPPDNMSKVPPGLFDIQPKRDFLEEEAERNGVLAEVNRQIKSNDTGRLFAVITLKGKQFKVTAEDILILQGYWAPNVGDRLRLHKVMLCGSKDFTMIGKPLLDSSVVRIEGTVIEKTLSYLKLHFRLKKRKNYRRMKFQKDPYTMLRINMIEILEPLAAFDESKLSVGGIADATFKEAARN